MTVKEISEKLGWKIIAGEAGLRNEVKGGYQCDLLSWVISHAEEGDVWMTVQNNINVVAVATLTEIACILLVDGVMPDAAMKEKAEEQGIPVLSTDEGAYPSGIALSKCL